MRPPFTLLSLIAAASLAIGWWGFACAQSPADAPSQPPSEAAPAADPAQQAEPHQTPAEQQTLVVHESQLQLTVPASWKVVKPRNNIIEMELAVPASDEVEPTGAVPAAEMQAPQGRVTMMSAGGDVDANIRRWVGQFRLGRDADGKDAMRRDRRKLRGAVAHVLDIAGTYFDSPQGPMGPKVELPDYRMLGAVIEVEGSGKYFVKFYGPAKIVDENREAFEQMLSSLHVVEPAAAEPALPAQQPEEAQG